MTGPEEEVTQEPIPRQALQPEHQQRHQGLHQQLHQQLTVQAEGSKPKENFHQTGLQRLSEFSQEGGEEEPPQVSWEKISMSQGLLSF